MNTNVPSSATSSISAIISKSPQILEATLSEIAGNMLSKQGIAGYFISNARLTLADPTPRLASDVFGGKSGQSHPMSHWEPIHIGRMAHNAYIHVGWYSEEVLFITTPSERLLHCTRSAPDQASGNIKHDIKHV